MSRGWKYAAASVIGTSHLKSSDGECQDSHCFRYDSERDLFVCAVSDGAGSAVFSALGSQLASSLAVERVSKAPDEVLHQPELARDTLTTIRDELINKAEGAGARLRDFASTLLVAIIHASTVTFWQIGDGAMCFRFRGEDHFNYAFWPAKGEYANVTQFITDENFLDEVEFDSTCADIVDLAVFTDGLERLALDFKAGEAHTKFFTGLFSYLHAQSPGHLIDIESKLAQFLSSDRVNSKTDDDKTLVLATTEN